MFEDRFSKETYSAVLEFRKTYNLKSLKKYIVQPQYFPKDKIKLENNEVFVDGGANIGDTAKNLYIFREGYFM